MKLINYIMASVLFLSATLLGSCSEEETTLSKAVLASASELNFEAEGAQPKTITVYADADWVMEDVPDWITVSPATGSGTMDVTVSVTDNMRDGAKDNPRKATIVFKGCTLASRAEVVVSQEGDKYRDCQEYTVDELPALEDETVVSVPEALVTAVTTSGCVVTDADHAVNMFLQTTTAVNVGDKVAVKGTKNTDTHSLPYVACDEARVVSEGNNVDYPEAHDVTVYIGQPRMDFGKRCDERQQYHHRRGCELGFHHRRAREPELVCPERTSGDGIRLLRRSGCSCTAHTGGTHRRQRGSRGDLLCRRL